MRFERVIHGHAAALLVHGNTVSSTIGAYDPRPFDPLSNRHDPKPRSVVMR